MKAFESVVFQIAVMVLLIVCGIVLYRIRWISESTNKQLSKLVISFVNPALMFYAYNIEFKDSLLSGLIQAFVVALIIHILFIIISKYCLGKGKDINKGFERFCCIYSNCAFIGIPLVSAVYGNEGVFYVTAYITVFNLLMWSHGIFLLSNSSWFDFIKKVLISPAILATFLGMFVFFAGIKLPTVVLKPIEYIANMNTPMAMIVSGVTVAQSDFFKAVKKIRIYKIVFWKLLGVPILALILFDVIGINHIALMSTILVSACPTATAATLLSLQYGQDEKYASQIFGMTTILSVVTLPILVYVGEMVCIS